MENRKTDIWQDPELAAGLIQQIKTDADRPLRFMEVCGTHTMSIFRHGIRSLLPESIHLISGPGCPVCVTDQSDIDRMIALCDQPDICITTFGDMMRVPGSDKSLLQARADGADIRIVYSPLDAVTIARETPDKRIVFLGIGFETTAPTTAAALLTAHTDKLNNFTVYSVHKTVPPALEALTADPEHQIDGFLLPGHVAAITGANLFSDFVTTHRIPSVVTGFEPIDILRGIAFLTRCAHTGSPELGNVYERVVTADGNKRAMALIDQFFSAETSTWRGIGKIPHSGLVIRDTWHHLDAEKCCNIPLIASTGPAGCRCGDILKGVIQPPDCPLFDRVCTPLQPVGPCMVSTEGTCAAYYRYSTRQAI